MVAQELQPNGQADGTVGKAVSVLEQVAAYGRPVRFAELLEYSALPKATLYRLLRTLTNTGLLAYDEDRSAYSPGLKLVRIAHSAWRSASLAPVARPHLDKLSAKLGATLHLAQLESGQVLYVDKRNAAEPIEMFSSAGKIGPGYCTGVGKAMIAFLPDAERAAAIAMQGFRQFTDKTLTDSAALEAECVRIRARGFAFDDEEHEPGIICIAMPILSAQGRVLGAVSTTTSTNRSSLIELEKIAPDLKETANNIASDVASWRFPD